MNEGHFFDPRICDHCTIYLFIAGTYTVILLSGIRPLSPPWARVLLGLAYTAGAVLYGLGKKRPWMHGVFHVFVLIGTVLQFICVYRYVLP